MADVLVQPGARGQKVKDMQWLLSGHNRYRPPLHTYRGEIDGDFGPNTAKAIKAAKWLLGYPERQVTVPFGADLRALLLPLRHGGRLRPPLYHVREAARRRAARPKRSYPLSRRGPLIGFPYQGTHTRGNWESDRAIDVAIAYGTPILACFDGTIGSQFGALSTHGDPRLLGLRCHLVGDGDEAYYAHLSSFAVGVEPGKRLLAGDTIGHSGSANGVSHLHWALKHGWPPSFVKGL